jgi:hypothetical protein
VKKEGKKWKESEKKENRKRTVLSWKGTNKKRKGKEEGVLGSSGLGGDFLSKRVSLRA